MHKCPTKIKFGLTLCLFLFQALKIPSKSISKQLANFQTLVGSISHADPLALAYYACWLCKTITLCNSIARLHNLAGPIVNISSHASEAL